MKGTNLDTANIAYLEELYRDVDEAQLPEQFRGGGPPPPSSTPGEREKQNGVNRLLWSYRELGYLYADLNPLKGYLTKEMRYSQVAESGPKKVLAPATYGLEPADEAEEFFGGRYMEQPYRSLKELIKFFNQTYCSSLGVEFLHIQNSNMRTWLMKKLEGEERLWQPGRDDRREILHDLIKAKEFERFLGNQFLGQKRFSLEGAEALIPAIRLLAKDAAAQGVKEIVLGMSHRGRLNVLANILEKPATEIFATFSGGQEAAHYMLSGDVKYHLGFSSRLEFDDGSTVRMSLTPNPSHLESVNPVVEGKTRGYQNKLNDKFRKKAIPVLIHGDAAFSGQGVVAETLNLSKLKGYSTGGTIHIIVNNQIGFTTASSDARSTFFPTNLAKGQPIPIFHVNGYDPEQVARALDLALKYRQKFGFDAIIDLICYRVHGHNEADEPTFTHPKMYTLIKEAPGVYEHYGQQLDSDGVYPENEQKEFIDTYLATLKRCAEEAGELGDTDKDDAFAEGDWQGFTREYAYDQVKTGVAKKRLKELGEASLRVPEELTLHRKLARIIDGRGQMIKEGKNIDWATGEMLAFASLLTEGYPIRLSGEDSGRGTFSHRHAVWFHSGGDEMKSYYPLQHLSEDQATFRVYDSPLSEFAVLGFEFGYSLARPKMLVLWEAQFGDFANEAQVIVDQYIAASETKWRRQSGLVMLLPHGYEGQGPEHSSAYLERYLQLCAEENLQICNCTTPAQFFHILRRQMLSSYRKPLIVMTPKSLLRDKRAVSDLDEFAAKNFRPIIHDGMTEAETLLVCSGKIYYELADRMADTQADGFSIMRIEQLYPFHSDEFASIIKGMKKLKRVRWVQEETRNRGAWSFIREYLEDLTGIKPEYIGRAAKASPATGHLSDHASEQKRILDEAYSQAGRSK